MYTEFEGDKLQLNNNNDKKLKTSRYVLVYLYKYFDIFFI